MSLREAAQLAEHIAVERELVPVAGFVQQQRRLADHVEREVGETDIDLEHRPMPAPLAEPLAKDQRVVAQTQEVVGADVRFPPHDFVGRGTIRRRADGGGVLTRRQLPLHQLRWFPSPANAGEEKCAHMCFTSSGMS